jgi:hypothetical protein
LFLLLLLVVVLVVLLVVLVVGGLAGTQSQAQHWGRGAGKMLQR